MDLVELGRDDDRHVTAVERQRERLLRAREPRGHRDGDLLGREQLGEGSRLLDSLRREPIPGYRRGSDPVAVRRSEAMPREEQLAHG